MSHTTMPSGHVHTLTHERPIERVPQTWRDGLPVLRGRLVTLRELRTADGAELMPMLAAPEVCRFMSPPPASPERFAAFVASAARERTAGRYAVFAIVPHGQNTAVGVVQLRQIEPGFQTAEWGIAIGSHWWGRGLFADAADLLLAFAFEHVGVRRLEARVAAQNARATVAFEKLGAVAEGLLRRSLLTIDGQRVDQVLYAWLDEDWRASRRHSEEQLPWVH